MARYRTVRRHLARAVEACQDTREPLAAAVAARTLAPLAAAVEREMVARAHARGASWTEVGEALGMTRQAAHERFTEAAQDKAEAEAVEAGAKVPPAPREPKVSLSALEAESLAAALQASGHVAEAEALRGRLLVAQAKAAGVDRRAGVPASHTY